MARRQARSTGRTGADLVKPALYRGIVRQVDILFLMGHRPGVSGDIGDAVLLTRDIAMVLQLLVQHAVQPCGFGTVAIDGVRHFLRGVLVEVVVLAKHRAEPRHLPEEPLQGGVPFTQFVRQQLVGFFRQIEQNGARFKQA